jgi:hypothetical protein
MIIQLSVRAKHTQLTPAPVGAGRAAMPHKNGPWHSPSTILHLGELYYVSNGGRMAHTEGALVGAGVWWGMPSGRHRAALSEPR